MPYKSIAALPDGVKSSLPASAQRIWMNAYNYASANPSKIRGEPEQYAWGAVKRRFKKVGSRWVKKSMSMSNITADDLLFLDGEFFLEAVATITHSVERPKPQLE